MQRAWLSVLRITAVTSAQSHLSNGIMQPICRRASSILGAPVMWAFYRLASNLPSLLALNALELGSHRRVRHPPPLPARLDFPVRDQALHGRADSLGVRAEGFSDLLAA